MRDHTLGMPDSADRLQTLNQALISCEACPRLRNWCRQVAEEKKAAHRDEAYWGLPVPHFGDAQAERLILGLAPAAHGANRTGRMFTGDRSGDWLFRALHKAGAANQPSSRSSDDGLKLEGVLITAVCHCAPPDNKPLPEEIEACRSHLDSLVGMKEWKAILCLGGIAWKAALKIWPAKPLPKFAHLAVCKTDGPVLVGSYHPSQQNTFTGRLTEEMLDQAIEVFLKAER